MRLFDAVKPARSAPGPLGQAAMRTELVLGAGSDRASTMGTETIACGVSKRSGKEPVLYRCIGGCTLTTKVSEIATKVEFHPRSVGEVSWSGGSPATVRTFEVSEPPVASKALPSLPFGAGATTKWVSWNSSGDITTDIDDELPCDHADAIRSTVKALIAAQDLLISGWIV